MNLTGGRTRDGGSIVGASVFYSHAPSATDDHLSLKSELDQLNEELKVSQTY